MAKSTRREKVKLVSTAGTGVYYTVNKLKGKDKLLLKNITTDELTYKKEAIILYNNMSAIVEVGEEIANGTVIKISNDYIVFEKDNIKETIFIQ